MQAGHETSARGRSPFAAAFLSLLFPGLGHAYLGAVRRGLGIAAPPLLLGALVAGFLVRMDEIQLAGLAVQTWFLIGLFIVNLVVFVYRAWAIVDAWLIARAVNGLPRSSGAVAGSLGAVSIVGLGAVLLVMSGAHLAVARYDLILADTAACIFDPEAECSPDASPGGSPEPTDAETAMPSVATLPPSLGPQVSEPAIPPWDGQERLNVLLIGADEQGGGHNTDTLITVSIDPLTNQIVMFSLPRDTVDVPIPPGPARNVYGSVYRSKINSLWVSGRARSDAWPGSREERGYNALKQTLGYMYGLDIKYYVEVNFDGFRDVIDALGGVTINVQVPVLDDDYPRAGGARERLYIPAGMQHMTGREALQYARSRKSTSDFERGARQQRVIVSVRQQLDIGQAVKNIDVLAAAIGQSVKTDIPRELVPQMLGLADRIGTRSIRSVIFTPPFYQREFLQSERGYIITPRVERIRQAVIDAFNIDPDFLETRDALLQEGAEVWVLNGSGRQGEAGRLAEFLAYLGINATAPTERPDVTPPDTIIRAYNGAETSLPLTAEALAEVFDVEVTPVTDASVTNDYLVITGDDTPRLTPPPVP